MGGIKPIRLLKFIRDDFWIGITAAVSMLGYLLVSALDYGPGFPLDDSWIHQTYSRNLALLGEWSFTPGFASGGSTSPLWTVLLAIGYLIPLPPNFLWTYFIGWLALLGVGIIGRRIFLYEWPGDKKLALVVGIFLTLEWHVVWAAASGMETLLFTGLALLVLFLLRSVSEYPLMIGVLIGASVWVRPDGLTLLGPALLLFLLDIRRWRTLVYGLAGLLITIIPYLVFNELVAGSLWPNTFYAKQAEYAIELRSLFWQRIGEQLALPLVGVGIILLPGFVLAIISALQHKRAWPIMCVLWLLGFLCIYAIRLPVTYQHGRYAMPVMPIYFILGLLGMATWVRVHSPQFLRRLLSRSWISCCGLVLILFWGIGADAYRKDVAFIETEMVVAARWINANTNADDLVAAHDIGALGYFSERHLLDLAGLISPEVIPFIRDEIRLAEYIQQRGGSYLVTFPGWYPELIQYGKPVFSTNGSISPGLGGENMIIYRWLTFP
jgi:hypothetical protein